MLTTVNFLLPKPEVADGIGTIFRTAWDTQMDIADAAIKAALSGPANSLKSPASTGLMTATGMGTGTTRAKTVRDADDTILELGGTYTPSGTWNWGTASVTWPTFNQSTTGTAAHGTTWGPYAGIAGPTQARTFTLPDADATLLYAAGSYSNPTWLTALAGTKINGFTTGRIPFMGASALTDDASLFWDNTNKRLGIGATPIQKFSLHDGADCNLDIYNGGSGTMLMNYRNDANNASIAMAMYASAYTLNTGSITAPDVYSRAVTSARAVLVDATGLLGNVTSSLRYKENVRDMEDVSWLYDLRPVNFNRIGSSVDEKEYGCIAEEVAKVNEAMITRDKESRPETVEYYRLVAPLLKIVQDQHRRITVLERLN